MTGYPPEGGIDAFGDGTGGATRLLLKPINPNDVIAALRTILADGCGAGEAVPR